MGKIRIFASLFLLFVFASSYAGEKTIIIDVGHGGKDNGFEIDGFREKDLALEIAMKILALHKNEDINIVLTRDSDEFISLDQRVAFINSMNPDYVISLHINSSEDVEVHGFDLYFSAQGVQSDKSNVVAQSLEKSIGEDFATNGIKSANFYMLKHVETPIALIELGYLSNIHDREMLTSEIGQQKIAEAIYNTIK